MLVAWWQNNEDQLGRAGAQAQVGLASGIIWFLEPAKPRGLAKGKKHGSEARLLDWGPMYLVVLRGQKKAVIAAEKVKK